MSGEKMRAEFEEWRDKRNAELSAAGHRHNSRWRVDNSHYPAWQASRAALVVELPDSFDTYGYSAEVARVATDCCAEAIEAAGVRVKP